MVNIRIPSINVSVGGGTNINLFQSSGNGLFHNVVPNIPDAYYNAKKRSKILGILIGAFFAALVASIVLFFVTGKTTITPGWEDFHETFGSGPTDLHPNMTFLPFIIIGAIGFVTCIIIMPIGAVRTAKLKTLKTLIMEIKAQEKTSLDSLSLSQGFVPISRASLIRIINCLIETGNLEGYEVIGEVGVARIDFHAHPSDFPNKGAATGNVGGTPTEPQQPRNNRCSACGSPITKKSGRFCEFCGTRLD